MGNCLVTKLKGSVSSDLLKLGEMRIKCSTAACGGTTTEAQRLISFNTGKNAVVTAGGRTFKAKTRTEENYYEVTSWTTDINECQYIFPDGEYEISITPKYSFIGIGSLAEQVASSFFEINVEDFEFSENIFYIYQPLLSYKGELKYFNAHRDQQANLKLTNWFSPITSTPYVDLDKALGADKSKLVSVELYEQVRQTGTPIYTKHSTGSINNINSIILERLLINGTEITGDIHTMIQNMISNGRTSGTIST